MRGDVLWPLLVGSTLTLGTTLLAQWFSLDFLTKRQREARRSDFQRTTLLQLRDALGELDDAVWELLRARRDASKHGTGWMGLPSHHPSFEAVTRAGSKVITLVTAVENTKLFGWALSLVRSSQLIIEAVDEKEADRHREDLNSLGRRALLSIGEQLRSLP
jgi:hypothetical protein